jgi:hypothetical protein
MKQKSGVERGIINKGMLALLNQKNNIENDKERKIKMVPNERAPFFTPRPRDPPSLLA